MLRFYSCGWLLSCFCLWCCLGAVLADESRPTAFIGYTEGRNDLPEGQFANNVTKRACLVQADGTGGQVVAEELIKDQFSWTQFSGWSPDGKQAVVLSAWESPENAVWEQKHQTFRLTEGWLVDSCLLDLASGSITNVAEGHCAMHGHWQPVKQDRAVDSSTAIVTVAKSTAEYTRKSEGDSIELVDGRLLLVYMEFAGDGSDFATTRLVAQESSDGGLSWNHHRLVTETTAGDMNVYSPNLIRAKDGGILLMFMRQHRSGSLTNHVWKSIDEGQTFMPFSEFVVKQNFSLCNATVKRLTSGRLLLPASPPAPGKSAESGPYVATVLMSDDDGLTWTVSQSRVQLPMRGAMEPHVEQTADGRVLMVMRNQLGKLHLSESTDDGATWSDARPTELTSPESCPDLTRIPGTDRLLMIWNNTYDSKFRSHFGKRSPLTAAISKDHGKTWQHLCDIESDPLRAYSNPGCRFTRDGRAIINYWTCEYLPDWRMQDVIDLRVAVMDRSWFYR